MFTSTKVTDRIRTSSQVEIVSYLSDRKKSGGPSLIDVSIGNPDLAPCEDALVELEESLHVSGIHGYGSLGGVSEFKKSIIDYYRAQYNVTLSTSEIAIVRGIRTVIFTITSLFAGKDDIVLIPSIAYPSYFLATEFAGATKYLVPTTEQTNFIPDLSIVPPEVLEKSKILFLNYPNNPTGAVIPKESLLEIVEIARKYSILIVYDNAYNEIVFDNEEPISLMEIEGAKEVGIELFSLSKLTSLAGWRISFCTGGKEIIDILYEYLSLTDTAPFNGFQYAAAKALMVNYRDKIGPKIARRYQERRDRLSHALDVAALTYHQSKGGFYIWVRAPKGDGRTYADFLVEHAGLLVTPGEYYGPGGKDYVRFSLTATDEMFDEIVRRIESLPVDR
ncbi:MAG: aminotransferase class I/II-fold pyridoxal phosphate-dependent enzyme [Sphaerochaetaceae bacterium]|nr:aminotransferase class I/II-fold pyridoxal phosphate-dependent enzyme [Sphaerochaetaceae bacterium]